MKRMLMIMMVAIAASSTAFGQMKTPKNKNNSIEAQLIALDKQAFEAWKNKDGSFYQSFLSEDSIGVGATGVDGKAKSIKDALSTCELKSYSLDNFRSVILERNTAAILTYKATRDATCNGQTIPATVWASTVFVKRGGKWLAAFHQETLAIQ